MAHLIDKDALVAEIESYKSAAEWMLKGKTDLEHWRSQKGTCEKLLSFINSLQEEPIAPKVLEDMLNAKTAAESLGISQEEHDKIVDKLIYGKEPELVDEDDLPTKKDYRERYKRIAESEEFRKNHDGMSIGDIVPVEGEEPVSDDLEEAAKHYLYSNILYDDVYVGNPTDKDCIEMFKAGANWKREQIAKENMLLPFKEYDNLMESINKRKKEGYEAGYKQGLVDSKSEQKPTLDIEIPFGAKDSELIEETISIPEGCYVIIKDNKIVIRKELCHQD